MGGEWEGEEAEEAKEEVACVGDIQGPVLFVSQYQWIGERVEKRVEKRDRG